MNIYLAPEYTAYLRQKVESGDYDSESEVVRDALDLLRQRDHLDSLRLEELRQKIAVGIEQADRGEVAPLDMQAILAKSCERLAQMKPQNLTEPQPQEGRDGTGAAHQSSGV